MSMRPTVDRAKRNHSCRLLTSGFGTTFCGRETPGSGLAPAAPGPPGRIGATSAHGDEGSPPRCGLVARKAAGQLNGSFALGPIRFDNRIVHRDLKRRLQGVVERGAHEKENREDERRIQRYKCKDTSRRMPPVVVLRLMPLLVPSGLVARRSWPSLLEPSWPQRRPTPRPAGWWASTVDRVVKGSRPLSRT